MTTLSKTLLTVALTGLAGGSVIDFHYNASANPSLTVILPVGAIASGLFLISLMMEKQTAIFDREQAEKLETLHRNASPPAIKEDTNPCAITAQRQEKTS